MKLPTLLFALVSTVFFLGCSAPVAEEVTPVVENPVEDPIETPAEDPITDDSTVGETTEPLNFVWYEDEFVKFQYPEGAVVIGVDMMSAYVPGGMTAKPEKNSWFSYSIGQPDESFRVTLKKDYPYDIWGLFTFYPPDRIEYIDLNQKKDEVMLDGDSVYMDQIGPEEFNTYLVFEDRNDHPYFIVHKVEGNYASNYDSGRVAGTKYSTLGLFATKEGTKSSYRIECKLSNRQDFEICVNKTDQFFSSFTSLVSGELEAKFWSPTIIY